MQTICLAALVVGLQLATPAERLIAARTQAYDANFRNDAEGLRSAIVELETIAGDRAVRRISERRTAEWTQRLSTLLGRRAPAVAGAAQAKLPVPSGDRVLFVPIDEIDWIEAADQYVIVHAGRKEYTLRQTIQSVLLKLPPRKFAQIHRSHAVNLSRVSEVVKLGKGDAQVVLTTGRELRLSRRFRDRLRESLGWPL